MMTRSVMRPIWWDLFADVLIVTAVRRKTTIFRRVVQCAVVAGASSVLFACAVEKINAQESHWEDFSPNLSSDDIRQIRSVVAARRDILQPVWKIATEPGRPHRATVTSGKWLNPGDKSDSFEVEKHNGRWRIISRIDRGRLKAENIMKVS